MAGTGARAEAVPGAVFGVGSGVAEGADGAGAGVGTTTAGDIEDFTSGGASTAVESEVFGAGLGVDSMSAATPSGALRAGACWISIGPEASKPAAPAAFA